MKLENLLHYHYQLFPYSQIEDFYKLIYQAVMGPNHLIYSKERAFYYLNQEIKNLLFLLENPCEKSVKQLNQMTPLFVDISLHIPIVRLNLLPYITQKDELQKIEKIEKLFFYFVRSAEEIIPKKENLIHTWQKVGEIIKNRELGIDISKYEEFTEKIIHTNFSIISHSIEYKNKYNPHYRIIKKNFLAEIL